MSAILERYSRAMRSSHLEMKVEPGDLDVLISAGKVKENLGTGLMRLRFEFDEISGMAGARNMLHRLKSAGFVKVRMVAMIMERSEIQSDDAHELVAKLLDAWCNPNCPTCRGRGTVDAPGNHGGRNSMQNICGDCGGSGKREMWWPEHQQAFAYAVADEMAARVDVASYKIARLLKNGDVESLKGQWRSMMETAR